MHNYLQTLLLTLFVIIASELKLVYAQDELIFVATTRPNEMITRPTPRPVFDYVLVNNMRVLATISPFVPAPPPTQEFLICFGSCPTTSEYSPICASNRQLYHNEQKFNCARFCGADIQIVRRGSCEGLFPMQRG